MALNVEFVGLACFRLWDDEAGPVVVTDPYTPFDIGMPETTTVDGDVIIASSTTDTAHFNPALVQGEPTIVNALDVADGRAQTVAGSQVAAVAVTEDPALADSAKDCAMYGFRLGGLDVVHMGDAGYVPSSEELAPFRDRCDVLLLLAGLLFTPPLEELDRLISELEPRYVIPMHYFLPPMIYAFRTEADFVRHRERDPVVYTRSTRVRLPLGDDLGAAGPVIVVLEAAGLAG